MPQVLEGLSQDILKTLPDKSVDLIITSPPYKDKDGYSTVMMFDVWQELYRVAKDNTLCFVNFGSYAGYKQRPFEVAALGEATGYTLEETIVWAKAQYTPLQKRLDNKFEFIFMFVKGQTPPLDTYAIGEEYEDKRNIKRYGKGRDLKNGSNLWRMQYEVIQSRSQKLHPDRFPIELPDRCIRLSGLKSGVVLDPFGGSGTTAVAAIKNGLDYVLIEKNPAHLATITERLKTCATT